MLYNFHVRRWELYHTLFIQMYAAPILRLTLKPETNIGVLFYPETVKQTASKSSTYTFNPARPTTVRNKLTVWRMFFSFLFTAFTATFYHILHHLNDGNKQKEPTSCVQIDHFYSTWQYFFTVLTNAFRTSKPLTRCLFGIECWILSSWLHYVTGLNVSLF